MSILFSKVLNLLLIIIVFTSIVVTSKVKATEDNIVEKAKIFASSKADFIAFKAKSSKSEQQFVNFLRTEVNSMVAVNYMSLWVLGKNRTSFSKDQIDRFIEIFTKNVTFFYGKIIYVNKDKNFLINRVFSNNTNTATIEFNVKLDKNNLLVDWQVRNSEKENKLLITDFVVNGISFLQAKRVEYNGLFESCRKDPSKFLSLLQSKKN